MDFIANIGSNSIALSSFFAIAILLVGIFIGKGVSYLLTAFINKIDLDKKIRHNLLDLIVSIIRWSIYLIFANLALIQLPFKGVVSFVSNILIFIPSFVAAMILLLVGFSIAKYLREILNDSQISQDWKLFGQYVFYFINFIIGIYALKLSLLPLSSDIATYILVISSSIVLAGIVFYNVSKEIKKD